MTANSSYHPEKRDLRILGTAAVLVLAWNFVSWQIPFFWDTVLNSKIAHWYLESGFSSITVPESMDAGHPPFFNLYLAIVWRITGPALWSAHLSMLPFLLILVVQYWKLCLRFLPSGMRAAAMVLLFCEPTFLAQGSMVTPDIVLVSLFLSALNAVLEGRRKLLGLVLVGMAASTFRGILAVPAIFFIDAGLAWLAGKRKPEWRKILPYLPVALLTAFWLWLHYRAVGWLLTPPPETYGAHRKLVGAGEMARNLGIVGWRFLDFGRVALWLAATGILLLTGLKYWQRRSMPMALLAVAFVPILLQLILYLFISEPPMKELFYVMDALFLMLAGYIFLLRNPASVVKALWREQPSGKQLVLVFLMPAALLTALFIPFSNPIGMRYFLVCYLLFILLVIWLVGNMVAKKWRKWVLILLGISLLSGHFWIYPDHIAKSWDSSLAYVTFFPQKRAMDEHIQHVGCLDGVLCTDFPMLAPNKYTFLADEDGPSWQDMKEKSALTDCDCVLYSPFSNGFSENDRETLKDERLFKTRVRTNLGPIHMELFQRVEPAED